jgi:putative transposase
VRRLMELMGLEAVYPKPKLSQPGEGHKIYPYLLNGVAVTRVNQVWSTDITYIRMAEGFLYLVAVMDWFSRFVLSWALSLTMEVDFCLEALDRALRRGRPEIFNSDQGSQFTSEKFTGALTKCGVAISMDGRGRCLDNIFIERLWRSLKYEEVYLRDYTRVPAASATGSAFTITSGSIRVWTTSLRLRCIEEDQHEEGIFLPLGKLPPDPRNFSLYRQNGWR